MTVTGFLHAKLAVADIQASLDFYCGLLGCRPIVDYALPAGRIVQVSPTGRSPGVELWWEAEVTPIASETSHVAFAVTDTEGLVETLRAAGVAIDREPFAVEDELIAFVRDPDGHLVELNQKAGGHL